MPETLLKEALVRRFDGGSWCGGDRVANTGVSWLGRDENANWRLAPHSPTRLSRLTRYESHVRIGLEWYQSP